MRDDIRDYLQRCYDSAKAYQTSKGRGFALTFSDYIQLWGTRRITKLTSLKDDGRLHVRMGDKAFGWVLTWRSRKAFLTGCMDRDTAQITTRQASKQACTLSKGEKHTPEAIEKIRAARTDTRHSDATKEKQSAAMKAYWAAKRGAEPEATAAAR